MNQYDVIIIGSGPAGLEAAITLKIRNRKVLVLSQVSASDKVTKAHAIDNYLGLPHIAGSDLGNLFINHAKEMDVEIIIDSVSAIYAMGKSYSLQTRSNHIYEAKCIILASGVNFGKPYEGEKEFLGRGVSYCATCDANFYKGKEVVVIGQNSNAEVEVNFLSEIVAKVTYIPLYDKVIKVNPSVTIIKDEIVKINGTLKVNEIVLKQQTIPCDGVFILRDNIAPDSLVPGLEINNNHVVVNKKMATNLPGLFACGDITGLPYQYIKAAGEGNIAAFSANEYLAKQE